MFTSLARNQDHVMAVLHQFAHQPSLADSLPESSDRDQHDEMPGQAASSALHRDLWRKPLRPERKHHSLAPASPVCVSQTPDRSGADPADRETAQLQCRPTSSSRSSHLPISRRTGAPLSSAPASCKGRQRADRNSSCLPELEGQLASRTRFPDNHDVVSSLLLIVNLQEQPNARDAKKSLTRA